MVSCSLRGVAPATSAASATSGLATGARVFAVDPGTFHGVSQALPQALAREVIATEAIVPFAGKQRGVQVCSTAVLATMAGAVAAIVGMRAHRGRQRRSGWSVVGMRCVTASTSTATDRASKDGQATALTEADIRVGARVRVLDQGIQFHHAPKKLGTPFNPKNLEGSVVDVIEHDHLTPNRPIVVKLQSPDPAPGKRPSSFIAHFEASELCLSAGPDGAVDVAEAAENLPPAADAPAPTEVPSVPANVVAAGAPNSQPIPSAASRVAGYAAGSSSLELDDRWRINLLYDGECPSCMKQVEFLEKRMDENPEYAGLVRLTDLTSPDYDPASCGGVVFEDGMQHIHAVTRTGEVVTGMDVFRSVYSIVGMEWVYAVTTLPIVGDIFDWAYDLWAQYRLQLGGRTDIIERIAQHQSKIEELSEAECEVECEVDWDNPSFKKV